MSSHTAEKIVFGIQRKLVRADIGYTPQAMRPLFVRNSLIEKNGTTPGGDQNLPVMALDRRYSHYMGRCDGNIFVYCGGLYR